MLYLFINPWPMSPVPHGGSPAYQEFTFWGQKQNYSKTRYSGQLECELRPRFIPSFKVIQVFLSLCQGGPQLSICHGFALQNWMVNSWPQGGNNCHCGAEGPIRSLRGSSLKGFSGQVVVLDLELESGRHH